MENKICSFIHFCLIFLTFSSLSFAGFTYLNVGARPTSLGGFTALADDPNATFYNPAGLNQITKLEITSTYGLLFYGLKGSDYFHKQLNKNLEPGLNENIVCSVLPLGKIGTAGIGWYNLSLGSFYRENILSLAFGKEIIRKLSAGITLKTLYKQYGRDIYTEQYELFKTAGYDKTRFSMDIGGIYEISGIWQLGVLIKDIFRPNMSLRDVPEDALPLQIRFGVAGKLDLHKIIFELIYDLISAQPKRIIVLSGIEYVLFGKFAFRCSIGAGNLDWYNFACGFGIEPFKWLKFHYSLSYPLTGIRNVFTHQLGLEFAFDIKREPKDEIKKKEPKRIDKIEKKKPERIKRKKPTKKDIKRKPEEKIEKKRPTKKDELEEREPQETIERLRIEF